MTRLLGGILLVALVACTGTQQVEAELVAGVHEYSFSEGNGVGNFHFGNLGGYAVNFSSNGKSEGYWKAIFELRERQGNDTPIEAVKVTVDWFRIKLNK